MIHMRLICARSQNYRHTMKDKYINNASHHKIHQTNAQRATNRVVPKNLHRLRLNAKTAVLTNTMATATTMTSMLFTTHTHTHTTHNSRLSQRLRVCRCRIGNVCSRVRRLFRNRFVFVFFFVANICFRGLKQYMVKRKPQAVRRNAFNILC